MIYPKDKCYFCKQKLSPNKKGSAHHSQDLVCYNIECKHSYMVVTSDCNMVYFKIDKYYFEYYFKVDGSAHVDTKLNQGMRVLISNPGKPLETIIDILEDKHYYVTLSSYLEVLEKLRKLSLFQ